MHGQAARQRITDNPFFVLGLSTECERAAVEREGHKLIGMLQLGLSAAQHYDTPLGVQERTVDKVREAMAELREPEKRLVHEMWARRMPRSENVAPDVRSGAGAAGDGDQDANRRLSLRFTRGMALLGWRRR